jgi:hypothetical protein
MIRAQWCLDVRCHDQFRTDYVAAFSCVFDLQCGSQTQSSTQLFLSCLCSSQDLLHVQVSDYQFTE